jgi:nucleoside-diphosphate-sugar epimerase
MRVLVTGGTGFTGTALVRRLREAGHEVVALDYKDGLQCDTLRAMGAEVVIGSVTDRAVVERSMRGVEYVFHLAAAFRELNVPHSFYDEVNVEGTRNVVEAALQAKVWKFVYCSTCGVHGNVDRPPANEDAPIQPADYYQRTKFEAEPLVRQLAAGKMEFVILRPAAIYGPGDPERFFMIFKRVAKGSFPMFGTGRTLYHPLYIDNLVDAFMLCLAPGVGNGREYLIADEHYYPIEEIVKAVGRALNVPLTIDHYPILPVSWPGTSAKSSASLSASCRRSFPGGWTGTVRTGPSTSAEHRGSWATGRVSRSKRGCGAPGSGIGTWATCPSRRLP